MPFGPPPGVAMTSLLPFQQRVTVPRWISTTMTEPSGIATGPSGNLSPSAITSKSMPLSRKNQVG